MTQITPREYYSQVFDKLSASFSKSNWVLGYGPELIAHGWHPDKLLVTAETIDNLWKLAVDWDLEVFIPIFAANTEYVLAPIDFEIHLEDDNWTLYAERHSQLHYFEKYVIPVASHFERILQSYHVPYVLDLTPSGGHVLFYAKKGTPAFDALASIGYLEPELFDAYHHADPNDIKRIPPAGFEAGSVFSGIGRLWHSICLRVKQECMAQNITVAICDSHHKCMNMDNSWQGYPGYMRIIRAPFSLHKKNIHKYHQGDTPLCDVMQVEYDGENQIRFDDFNYLTKCMWHLDMAADHAAHFTGEIPVANENLVTLIKEQYVNSPVYAYDSLFDSTPSLAPGEAFHRVMHDSRVSEKSKHMSMYPNPRALQPKALKKFVWDLMVTGWSQKHIGDLLCDLYSNPRHKWHDDWAKCIARTRAYFWARALGSELLLEAGKIKF